MRTQIHFTCANCGAQTTLAGTDALGVPLDWYRVVHDFLGAYVCSWDCLVGLGPTLVKPRGEARR